jgi:hypothetical protein
MNLQIRHVASGLAGTFMLYVILWIDLFLPPLSPRFMPEALSGSWFLWSAAKNALRFLVMLLLLADGLRRPGLPRTRDIPQALLAAACIGGCSMLMTAAAGFAKGNAFPFPSSAGPGMDAALLASAGMAAIATGYAEESFFRFLAVDRLEAAGFSLAQAILITALLFGISHASQGLFGMIASGMIGVLLSFLRTKGMSLHALALGHGIYNFAIFAA